MNKLRPFGNSPYSWNGYELNQLIGHIETLIQCEEDIPMANNGPRAKRLNLIYDALDLLNKAAEY